jgi:hypothetical protein
MPCDFELFPTLKLGLTETCFETMKDIKSNVTAELQKIPKESFSLLPIMAALREQLAHV